LRGLRAVTDFEFEFQIGLANMDMAPQIETVFLLSEPKNIFISSSLIKEIAINGGSVSKYLPAAAEQALLKCYSKD
ncbi:MAG: pantetheine-phosphate adenylyltransferase, partial [Myxococcota bacterium]|nr:pantetheine-phosphate adenylyltransferase [Myxococcota bacterium]